jgi:hypothetical protein
MPIWNTALLRQFGAAIAMLENAITACPDDLWQARIHSEDTDHSGFGEFWYVAYHTIFWLDFYLSDTAETEFKPPEPYTLSEFDWDALPERVYTKDELLAYLEHGREKCRAKLESADNLLVPQKSRSDWPDMSVAELLIYTIRHVMEHAAQLSLFLGQEVGEAPGWVSKA